MIRRSVGIPAARRGFSLVEVLLAVFILGIGVISIAAIFPAGITLQRQSNDDVMGPQVAQQAMAVLRSKLTQEDFGSFSDFNATAFPPFTLGSTLPGGGPFVTVQGDWPWMRPGFVFDDTSTTGVDEGALDIFSQQFTRKSNGMPPFTSLNLATEIPGGWPSSGTQSLWGIPYNPAKYAILPNTPPQGNLPKWQRAYPEPSVLVTQRERYWPMGSNLAGSVTQRPQYVWECMFRRFNGRVQVAIFVYRVGYPGGQPRFYTVAPSDPSLNAPDCLSFPTLSPLPKALFLPTSGTSMWVRPATGDPTIIPGTASPAAVDLTVPRQMWQAPGQWILDQNGNVHRVLAGRRVSNDGSVRFARPIPSMPPAQVFGWQLGMSNADANAVTNAVLQAWYLPLRDANGVVLTPVYVSVEEL